MFSSPGAPWKTFPLREFLERLGPKTPSVAKNLLAYSTSHFICLYCILESCHFPCHSMRTLHHDKDKNPTNVASCTTCQTLSITIMRGAKFVFMVLMIPHIETPCRASNEPSKPIKKCERKLNKRLT